MQQVNTVVAKDSLLKRLLFYFANAIISFPSITFLTNG